MPNGLKTVRKRIESFKYFERRKLEALYLVWPNISAKSKRRSNPPSNVHNSGPKSKIEENTPWVENLLSLSLYLALH
jgi:hypothetical protein